MGLKWIKKDLQAVAEVVPSSRSVQVELRFSLLKIYKVRYTDHDLDQNITRYINNAKVPLTDQNLDTQIKSGINRIKDRSTYQKLA